MNDKVKRKLLFVLIIVLVIFFVISLENKKLVLIKDTKETKLITEKDFKKVNTIIHDPVEKIDKEKAIPTLLPKYELVKEKDVDVCTKDGKSSVVISKKNYDVVVVELGNTFEYFKENNGKCTSLGKIENVNFTDSTVETYANESIYSNFDSLSNFELSGLIRITADGNIPFDKVGKRYSNPTAFNKGVLLIENNRSIVAFDKNDKKIFAQNNDSNLRNVLAINMVNNSLFAIVKNENKITLEAYSISDEESISKSKPKLSYDISKLFNKFDSEIVTKSNNEYGSFSSGGKTIIVRADFSKLFSLQQTDTTLAINESLAFLKSGEIYYVADLATQEREDIGSAQVLSFRSEDKSIYFTILDGQGKEMYIRYNTR